MTRVSLLGAAVALVLGLGACTPSKPVEKGLSETEQLARAKILVDGASKNVAQAERVFPGLGGMVGVVIGSPDGQGRKGIVWMSPDGSAIFAGPAMDEKGENVNERVATEQRINEAGTDPNASTSPASAGTDASKFVTLLTQSADPQTQSILQGTAGPIVTVFMDLNCSHCHTFFVNAQPLVKAGKMRVRYVLVGFLTDTSVNKAAAVLKAADPLAALVKAEEDFAKNGQKGKPPAASNTDQAHVGANTKLLSTSGNISTPLVLFCGTDKTVQAVPGAPTDMAAFLKDVSTQGHPACSK